MDGYFCPSCERIFEKDSLTTSYEHGEFWGNPYTVEELTCPMCGDDIVYIEQIHCCDECGDLCIEDYIETSDNRYYCSECYKIKNIYD